MCPPSGKSVNQLGADRVPGAREFNLSYTILAPKYRPTVARSRPLM